MGVTLCQQQAVVNHSITAQKRLRRWPTESITENAYKTCVALRLVSVWGWIVIWALVRGLKLIVLRNRSFVEVICLWVMCHLIKGYVSFQRCQFLYQNLKVEIKSGILFNVLYLSCSGAHDCWKLFVFQFSTASVIVMTVYSVFQCFHCNPNSRTIVQVAAINNVINLHALTMRTTRPNYNNNALSSA